MKKKDLNFDYMKDDSDDDTDSESDSFLLA